MEPKIEIFLSYCRQDEKFCRELMQHLVVLQRQQSVSFWYDHEIKPGTNWVREIQEHVHTAQVILLLVSADYLASEIFAGEEVKLALERQNEGNARVIPIILRPCLWKNTAIGDLEALPTNGKPVSKWSSSDLAFVDITRGIRQMIKDQPISSAENVTTSAPMSMDEMRLAELEQKLREYSLVIQSWGAFLGASNDPKEKAQAQAAIARQRESIATALTEYRLLVRKWGHSVPTEILQLLARFDEYKPKDETEDVLKALHTLSTSELRLLGFDLGINLDVFLKGNQEADFPALLDYARQHSLMKELTNYALRKRRTSSP